MKSSSVTCVAWSKGGNRLQPLSQWPVQTKDQQQHYGPEQGLRRAGQIRVGLIVRVAELSQSKQSMLRLGHYPHLGKSALTTHTSLPDLLEVQPGSRIQFQLAACPATAQIEIQGKQQSCHLRHSSAAQHCTLGSNRTPGAKSMQSNLLKFILSCLLLSSCSWKVSVRVHDRKLTHDNMSPVHTSMCILCRGAELCWSQVMLPHFVERMKSLPGPGSNVLTAWLVSIMSNSPLPQPNVVNKLAS